MIFRTLLIATLLSVLAWPLLAQNDVVHPSILGQGTFIGISQPLKDIPPLTATEIEDVKVRAEKKMLNKKLRNREYPFAETALPKGEDAAWQKTMGNMVSPKAPILNFDGQTSPYYPPDCNGTAIKTEKTSWMGHGQSIVITLPPLSGVILQIKQA